MRLGQGALAVGLGVGRAANLGLEALGGELRLALCQPRLLLDDVLGRFGGGQRPGLRRLRLGLLGLGHEARRLDGDVALVLRLQGDGFLLPLIRFLVGLGLGDWAWLATAAAWGAARLLM